MVLNDMTRKALFWLITLTAIFLLQVGVSSIGWIIFLVSTISFLFIPVKNIPTLVSVTPKMEILLLLIIFIIAIFLRAWNLENVPPACWFDEAENALETIRILNGDFFFFTPNNNGRGALQFFWTVPFFAWFGANIFSLRLASAVLGILTIPAAWLLFRRMAGPTVGLLATAFLAVSRWHLTISRIGFDAIMTPLFDILVIYTVIRACQSGLWIWFGLSGFLAAFANYGYTASRLTPLLLIGTYFLYFINYKYCARKHWHGIIMAGIVFGLTLTPLMQYALKHPGEFTQRSRQVSTIQDVIGTASPGPLLRNIRSTIRMFHERGDYNARHNLPGKPMLDPITGLMFVVGLVFAWKQRKNFSVSLVLSWLVLVLIFGGVLTRPAPHGLRTLSTVIPISLLAAWGVQIFFTHFNIAERKQLILAAALIIASGAISFRDYFISYAHSPAVYSSFTPLAYEVGKYIKTISCDRNVLVSQKITPSVVKFVSLRDSQHLSFFEAGIEPLSHDENTVYITDRLSDVLWLNKNEKYEKKEIVANRGERFFVLTPLP